MPGGWLEEFHPFTLQHLVTVLFWLAAAAALVVAGRKRRGTPAERTLRRAFGFWLLAIEVAYQVWENLGARYDARHTLPLHACDLVAWFAVAALLTERRLPRAVLYFVGLGLSTQTFLTPTVDGGLATAKYWFFWGSHTSIVAAAVYLLAVLDYRPERRDLKPTFLITLGYALVVTPVNLLVGANYGYVGDELPGTATVLDYFGPWPLRAFVVLGLTLLVFTLMWWIPARIGARRRRLA